MSVHIYVYVRWLSQRETQANTDKYKANTRTQILGLSTVRMPTNFNTRASPAPPLPPPPVLQATQVPSGIFNLLSGMLHTTLPLECWELVIDSCNIDDPWPLEGRRVTYSTFRSCALTCRALHPRSRHNLLRSVELNTEAQVDLLIRTLTQQPFLADLITEVFHRPLVICSERPSKYVPLARSPLPSLLRNCRSLAFPLSSSLHPINYIHALASFSHITRLAIFVSGHSISTLLHVVWSYPEIYQVSLVNAIHPTKSDAGA